MAKSYLILGSNSADKRENLERAVLLLSQNLGTITQRSSIYQSAAWGYDSPNNYLNQVIIIETRYSAEDTLRITQKIEKKLGRKVKSKNGIYQDRPIDIDILFFDQMIISQEDLDIPHPRIEERRFVLEPLCEIIPNLTHPATKKSIKRMLLDCQDTLMVKRL